MQVKKILTIALSLWLCGAAVMFGATVAIAEPIRVAHDQRFPPFAEVKEGRSDGLAVDILKAAAAKAGLELTLVPVPFVEV
ncbi:transporter substrate-binding domain-containing protein [Microbacteriaceae bacterium K1510]|nr:transporter substrate-binding domain-containing protein [Microbacteriaceae bacterium K1510]